MNIRHFSSFVCASFLLFGCDGGGGGGTDAAVEDAGPTLEPSELFGPCEEDSQCPGEGAICRSASDGYPGGYCTVPCEDRTPCDVFGVYHHCATRAGEDRSYCEQRCLNGLDCGRPEYTCAGELPPSGGVCIGICSTDDDCGAGTQCDPYTGLCTTTLVETGATTGQTCADDDACRSGICVNETSSAGQPTGWAQGYCISQCILPVGYNRNSFFAGDALPTGSCPTGNVCWPQSQAATAQQDLGWCVTECTSNADCRTGYACLQDITLSSGATASYSNGVCFPGNCMTTGCPDGYTCQAVTDSSGATRNVCGR